MWQVQRQRLPTRKPVVGWNRWRNGSFETNSWDFSGVSIFDLSSGNLLSSVNYPDGGIAHLSLLEGNRDIVRVVTEDVIQKFGQSYAKDLVWTARDGSILPGPIPYTGPTEPLTDFYFSSGSIIIEADDKSRIELTPIAQVGESAFNVKVLGPNVTELGNFPMEILNVKCIERPDTCAVPAE